MNIGTVYGARLLNPGKSDVVWTDPSAGKLALWQMNGTAPAVRGAGIDVPTGYTLLGNGSFAGYSTLFRDASNQLVAWKYSGTSFGGYRIVTGASVTTPAGRAVVATGDLDGDGITDVMWKDTTTGEYGVWMMDDGPTIRDESPFRQAGAPIGPVPEVFRVVGIADFDGDGGGEVLWQDTSTRRLTFWSHLYEARAGQPIGSIVGYKSFDGVLPIAHDIAAIGDFDGDSVADIAWSTPSGNIVLTLTKRSRLYDNAPSKIEVGATMSIPLTTGPAVVGAPVPWKIAGSGDFDGDGTSDLLWRSALDGTVATSPMSGGGVRDAAIRGFGGKCLTTSGYTSANGTGLVLWDCLGQDNQKWTLRSDGTLRGFGGKCVSTNGTTSANGTGLLLWDCVGQDNQKWTLQDDGTLRGLGGRVLSTSGYTHANGTKLVLWDGVGQDNQKWTVSAVMAPTAAFSASARIAGTLGREPTPR